jgi:hypothetical protein
MTDCSKVLNLAQILNGTFFFNDPMFKSCHLSSACPVDECSLICKVHMELMTIQGYDALAALLLHKGCYYYAQLAPVENLTTE